AEALAGAREPAGAASPDWCVTVEHAVSSSRQTVAPTKEILRMYLSSMHRDLLVGMCDAPPPASVRESRSRNGHGSTASAFCWPVPVPQTKTAGRRRHPSTVQP